MATIEDILLPDIGDFAEVEIIEVLVAPGDRVEPEQSLVTLESDKATMEIPSPIGGVVREIKVAVGDQISQGSTLLTLEGDEASANASPEPTAQAPIRSDEAAPTPTSGSIAPGQRTSSATETVSVVLPDIGDFPEIPVIEVLVAVGDQVEIDQSLLTLESDKATMEIPSPYQGSVESLAVKVGDTLDQGDLILTMKIADEVAQDQTPSGLPEPSAEETEGVQAPAAARKTGARLPGEKERQQVPVLARPADIAAIAAGRTPHASPAVRRFARELGVDLTLVKGSGPKSRILKDDVQGFVKQSLTRAAAAEPGGGLPFRLPTAPEVDYARFGEVELSELPRIKKISGAHLHRCWLSVPHVTQFDAADITALEAFRQEQKAIAAEQGLKLTFMPFLLKAAAAALKQMPNLKSSLTGDGERRILKHFTHIGVAVDTPDGLMVPVVRDVDKKGVMLLAEELMTLGKKARDGKLLPGDMQGGCFSISSLGGIGGTAFTPIVNAPEVAILGVSKSEIKPVWDGSAFAPRLMLPLSLSYDHRVVDGAEAVRFTSLLSGLLGDIRRLLL